MKTSNAAIATFIDEKYIPLAPKIKLGIAVGIVLLPIVVFYFSYYQQKATKIQTLNNKQMSLTQQIKEVKLKASDLAKFEKEMAEAGESVFRNGSASPQRERKSQNC